MTAIAVRVLAVLIAVADGLLTTEPPSPWLWAEHATKH